MDFDIIIATKNRKKALIHSLLLMLSQRRYQRILYLVDDSEDHEEIKGLIQNVCEQFSKMVTFAHSYYV